MGCEEEGKKTYYTGESSRSMYLRGKEHKRALEDEEDDSVL